jgi:hypothetical protein
MQCPFTGKRAYVDEAEATAAIERAWTSPTRHPVYDRMPKRAYLCERCGWWHLTSKRDAWR